MVSLYCAFDAASVSSVIYKKEGMGFLCMSLYFVPSMNQNSVDEFCLVKKNSIFYNVIHYYLSS